jgi:hypothetical protein
MGIPFAAAAYNLARLLSLLGDPSASQSQLREHLGFEFFEAAVSRTREL